MDRSLKVLGRMPVLSKCSINTEHCLFVGKNFFWSELCEFTRSVHRPGHSDLSTLSGCNIIRWLWGCFLSLEGDEAQRNSILDRRLLKPCCPESVSG